MSHRTQLLFLALFTSLWAPSGWFADVVGAELRYSSRGQSLVRQASFVEDESPADVADEGDVIDAVQVGYVQEVPGIQDMETHELGFYEEGGCVASCGPPARMWTHGGWAEFEYLMWWRRDRYFPALVTTQPNSGLLPDATILFGNGKVDEQGRPGGRLGVGVWLDACQSFGIGGHYVALGDAPIHFVADSDTIPFLARPTYNAANDPPTPNAFVVATDIPAVPSTGNVDIQSDSEFEAADVYFRWNLRRCGIYRFDFLAGYQAARLDEDLRINTQTLQPVGDLSQSIAVSDVFDTKNEFHGGHFGFQGEYRRGCWGLELLAKFGFGNMRQSVNIQGSTTVRDVTGSVDQRDSGLLAQSLTNAGNHVRDEFTFMEDVGIKLAYYPASCIKLSAGYSLMYLSSVARPGEQVNLLVDGRLLGGVPPLDATQPAFSFDTTHYYAHGLNFGLEYRF